MPTREAKPALTQGEKDAAHESIFRCGFEATLHPDTFEKNYEAVIPYLQEHYPTIYNVESFRRGYALGQDYAETIQER